MVEVVDREGIGRTLLLADGTSRAMSSCGNGHHHLLSFLVNLSKSDAQLTFS